MSIDLPPDIEARLREKALRLGVDPCELVADLVQQELDADESNPRYLMSLPREKRNRIMEAQFNDAASLYAADLSRPVQDRELTAFTALDSEPVLEYDTHGESSGD